jgi:AcrR family transcriptional regulator
MRVKSEARRQAILDIAKEAFTEQGFEQTSMSFIAKKLGGSKATLYNYFSSKEEIFSAVMKSSTTEQISLVFRNLSIHKGLKAELIDFGFCYLKSILSPELTAIHKMALAESDRSDIGRFFYQNGPSIGWQSVTEFFQDRIDDKTIRPCDPHIAALQLKGLLEAELKDPYELGVIEQPGDELLQTVVKRAIESFLDIYEYENTESPS